MQRKSKNNIIFWNAQGIKSLSKKIQLQHIPKDKYTDIRLFREIFLKEENSVSLPGNRVYRQGKQSTGSRVAVEVRNNIKTKNCPNYELREIENLSLEIYLQNRTLITHI